MAARRSILAILLLIGLGSALVPGRLCSRRHAVVAGAAACTTLTCAQPASAIAYFKELTLLDKETAERTEADFSSVIEIRPIGGPLGAASALVVVDAGNAGDFDYVWLKNAATNEVVATIGKKQPPPMMIKAPLARGMVIKPMAYSKEAGLWEGDAFLVNVGEWRPDVLYPGRPDGPIGLGGEAAYANR